MSADPKPPDPESFESVLARALVAQDSEGSDGCERVLAAHPSLAARLREHLDRLRGYGLIEKTVLAPASAAAVDGAAGRPASTTPPDFPERLGDFRLLRRIGGGGMGVVYLAEQESLRRRVALKVVRREHRFFPDAADRFRREVDALAKLQHPGIVPVYQAGDDGGVPWLAMEHVVGASLDEVLRRLTGRDPARLTGADLGRAVRDVVHERDGVAATSGSSVAIDTFGGSWVDACLRVVQQVALALQHAHERGVLHRDVKPSNVMLTPDGRALLLDFGLARADGSIRLTGTGTLLGSPAYMSPEQMRDAQHLDARTDVYSLGVTLYELLTLRMPFAGESAASTRDLVLAGQAAPLRLLNRSVGHEADVVCRKAMDVDAGRRYATAAAFAADLDNVLAHRPIQARPPGPVRHAWRWAQRHPARATAAVAAFLVCGVAPSVFLLQQRIANRAIQEALTKERQQRARARDAVDTMFTRVANEDLFDLPRLTPVRRDLLAKARTFYEQFLAEAGDDPELRAQTADTAARLANVELKLGQAERALAAATRAEELAASLPAEHADLLRHALQAKASAQFTLAHHDDALRTLERAEAACAAALQRTPDDAGIATERLALLRARCLLLAQTQRIDEALASHRRLHELWRDIARTVNDAGELAAGREELLSAAADEAELHVARADFAAAADAAERADELLDASAPDATSLVARMACARLAKTRSRAALAGGDAATAVTAGRRGLALVDELLAEFPDYANGLRTRAALLNDLAMALTAADEADAEAKQMFDASIATLRRLLTLDPAVAENRANLAASLVNRGAGLADADPRQARPLFEEALALATRCVDEAPAHVPWRTVAHNAAWFLGQVCIAGRDHAATAAAAERMAALQPDDARTQRIASGLLAQAITALDADATVAAADRATRRAALADTAMRFLQRAAALGCADHEWVATSDEFAPLRALPGAAEIMAQLARNADRKQ